MKNHSSVKSARAIVPASLVCIICLLIPGSLALSQPFPSFMLDSTIVRVPTFNDAEYTSVAFGPHVGLIVWVESGVVLGARVDTSGALLDAYPIDIRGPDAAGFVNMRPGVAWGGNRFLVVWTEVVDYQCDNYARCALVREDGTVAQRYLLQDSIDAAQAGSAAAFDGTNFLALWTCYTMHNYMQPCAFFARVSPSGVVLDSPPRRMTPPDSLEQELVDVCFYGGKYLAVSTVENTDTRGVWGNIILPDGTIPDSAGFLIKSSIGVDCPSVTHDRHNYIVGWYELHDKTKLARISDSGELLDSAGVLLDSSSNFYNDVFSIGDTTLVAYVSVSNWNPDSLTLVAVRVDTALQKLDSSPIALSWTETANTGGLGPGAPSLARCGSDYFAAWFQPYRVGPLLRVHNAVAYYRRLTPDGRLVDSTQMVASFGTNEQTGPGLASDGADFLAAWIDSRRDSAGEHSSLYAERFTANGALLDPTAIPIPRSDGTYPLIAYAGGCYLVVWWSAGDHAVAARVRSDGLLMDTIPILLSGPDTLAYSGLDVAAGDSTFLVAWSTSDVHIHGVRVTTTGVLLDSAPLVLQKNTNCYSFLPQVGFDGVNFLVARYDQSISSQALANVPTAVDSAARLLGGAAGRAHATQRPAWDGFSAVRVNSEGQIIDPDDIRIVSAGSWRSGPELTFGDGVYLVTGNDRYVSWRMSSDGVVLDSVPHPNSGFAKVYFDGTNFLLLCTRDNDGKLAAMRISPDGVLLDSTPYLLVYNSSQVRYHQAALVANTAGRIGLVFEDFEPYPLLNYRVRASTFPKLGVGSQYDATSPVVFRVLPNPASRMATLSFNLTQAGPVRVTAFDVTGRRYASLFSGRVRAGSQTLPLDTRRLANGVYFIRLGAGEETRSTRLVISH